MDHQSFTITYKERTHQITALVREEGDDLVYDCYSEGVLLGTVRPTLGDDPIVIWKGDDMPPELVCLIGEAIERQDA